MGVKIVREAGKLIAAVAVCQLAGLIGVLTSGNTGRYYRELETPSFAPPGSVFGPVWVTLYTMMGVALYLVWRRRDKSSARKRALGLFGVQLALNAAWTPAFFGLQQPGLGLIVIALLLVAVIATILAFWPVAAVAAALLIPYLLWVAFATALNFEIWRNN